MSSPWTTYTGMDFLRKPTDDEIDVAGMTHQGKVRKSNQDQFLICSLRRQIEIFDSSLTDTTRLRAPEERLAFLAMVADGVGGGAMGEEASRLAIEIITEYVTRSTRCFYTADASDDRAFAETLQEAAMQTHQGILQQAQADPARTGMATTLTLWLGVWPRAYLLQVGDSRYYTLHEGQLRQVSRDQTMAQELIESGVIRKSDPAAARWSHVLSSAIGGKQTAPMVTRLDQNWGDVHLLCSDGLTKHVPDQQIRERLLNMNSAPEVCAQLVQDALDGGGTDNVTVIVGRAVKRDNASR
ncbi:MAG TPA: protein phosphatase 2C domain-containing protein [Gemmatimonadales bacterium]|nr:protein phosphatase 2C domain-containing protein [Gemmatimonadales bacterium]